MTKKLIFRTLDQTVSIDWLAGGDIDTPGYWIRANQEAIKFGSPQMTETGKTAKRNGEPLTNTCFGAGAHWTTRIVEFEGHIKGSSRDDLRSRYRTLYQILTSSWWEIVHNGGGATEQDRYYDCMMTVEIPPVETITWEQNDYKLSFRVEARPYARGAAVVLPRNYVIDPGMYVDFSGGGLPASFALFKSGTPTYTIAQIKDGNDIYWTKIQVSAGAAGDGVGIVQSGIACVAGDVISSRIEYKSDAATGGCSYVIEPQEIGGTTPAAARLLNNTTAAQTGAEAKVEGRTVSAGTTSISLYVYISLSATGTGTLWVRNAMIVKAATLPTGADGGTLVCGTQVAQSPATLPLDNLPGDCGTLSTISLVAADNAGTLSEKDKFTLGVTPAEDNITLPVISFTGTANTDCLGGQCYAMNWTQALVENMTLRGTYYVFVRVMSTGSVNQYLRLKQYASDNYTNSNVAYQTPNIPAFSVVNKWETICMGVLGFPLADYIDESPANYVILDVPAGSYTGSQYVDYVAFVPVVWGFCRAELVNNFSGAIMNNHGIVLDNIQNHGNLTISERFGATAYENYPFAASNTNPVQQASVMSDLVLSTNNKLTISASRGSTAATTLDIISPAILTIRYAPLYLE